MPGPYRLWPATAGPSAAAADTTAYTLGVEFYVTATGLYLYGFWWWCAPGADTAPKAFQLFSCVSDTVGTPVDHAGTVSGALTAGVWNFAPLPDPVPLVQAQHYRAGILGGGAANWYSATGGGFPADMVNGPLVAPATTAALGGLQGNYVVGSTLAYPRFSAGGNYWIDVLVSEAAVTAQTGRARAGASTGPASRSGAAGSPGASAGVAAAATARGGT